ncbi:MAG: thioredoxin domain-containing protein [Myxococcota bacterium]|nr:thioredoxin domain-containing protein [Myxococcota bacterium]
MNWLTLLVPFAQAEDTGQLPTLYIAWKKDLGQLVIDPPAGEHLAPEAPMGGWLEVDGRHLSVEGSGQSFAQGVGLTLPGDGPHTVQGELSLSLCENGGTACRPVSMGFIGQIDGRKGQTWLAVHPVIPENLGEDQPEPPAFSPEDAFQAALADDKLVLLDFSAVWCPPCNALAAEVLHADRPVLDDFHVVLLDADTPASWAWKDRYQVGGYPTVVLARADGSEVDRRVGYESREDFEGWLAEAAQGQLLSLDEQRAQATTPQQQAALALRLAGLKQDQEALDLLELPGVLDHADARIARFDLLGEVEDARWLAESAPTRILEWGWGLLSLERTSEDNGAFFAAASKAILASDSVVDTAFLLHLQAQFAGDPAVTQALNAAAAATLESALVGDPELDRAHWTALAGLYEDAGQPERALSLLQEACGEYPHELTFFHAAAGLLLRQERYDEGLPYAHAALALSYGDQRLRAAMRLARLMDGAGDREAAIAVLETELGSFERPDPELQVRSHRYVTQTEALLAELQGE